MQHLLTRTMLASFIAVAVSAPAFAQMHTSSPSGGSEPSSNQPASGSAMRTSAGGTVAGGDASVAAHAGSILSDSGMIYAPRYLPAGNLEGGVAVGLANGTAAGAAFNQPLGLAALSGNMADGLDWGVMLSGQTQLGVRQRYGSGDSWSWGGSYLGRVNFAPGTGGAAPTLENYGLTYRNELMYSVNGLDLFAQPEVSYYLGTNNGAKAALAIGADYWFVPQFSLGLSAQGLGNFGSQPYGALETAYGVGAKLFPSDNLWVFASDNYFATRAWNAAMVGVGYRWR